MKKARPRWGVQGFLNDAADCDKGWINGRIDSDDWGDEPSITLDIGDCARVITLDFRPDSLSKRDKAARIRKLRRLQKLINTFVEKAIEVIEAAEPKPKEVANAEKAEVKAQQDKVRS